MLSTYNKLLLITVNDSEEEITIDITLNMGVLQTLLETTANDLLQVFKASRQAPEQSDDEVRGEILRELYVIKKALMDSKQQSQSLENESMSEVQCNEPGPSTSSPSLNSAGAMIDLPVDSKQEDSESVKCEQSPKVGQKRSREESHLSSPPTKRVCCSTSMRKSTWFNITVSNSSANSQNADGAASESILSLNLTTPSGNMNADVTHGNFQANQNKSIPSTSSSPSGESSFSGGSSVTFKRSCSKAGSSKSRQKGNQEPANILNKRSTTECIQPAETVNSKCDESSYGPRPTGNTTNSEISAAGPSHKTGVLSEKASTSEASTKQNIDSQGSATSMRTKKRYKQSHLAVLHDQKQSQAGTGHGLSLSVSLTKGKVTGEKGSSKSTKRPRKKESHLTSQEISSESADRKHGSRCPKSKKHLCPVCGKRNCGKCKNCL